MNGLMARYRALNYNQYKTEFLIFFFSSCINALSKIQDLDVLQRITSWFKVQGDTARENEVHDSC